MIRQYFQQSMPLYSKYLDCTGMFKRVGTTGSAANVGVAVRNIRLVHDNVEQIEGKVDGQQIVILTKFVKKS